MLIILINESSVIPHISRGPLARGSIVSYNGKFGFMGFFTVKPEYRSNGIGRKLWFERRDKLIARLEKGVLIGMDGVVAIQSFYKTGGFEIAYRDERHERTGEEFQTDPHISSITAQDMDSILSYDAVCFGFQRPQFLLPWLNMPNVRTLNTWMKMA